ncbi:queuine tRNA-ribosyltransferase accessory subunit 2 isoform X2 [Halyomorpha halys]|uniref:queuine tRNA-ribosyltransferase accessory subunit 2 isoform X2 n=1 Tax=Halyomorpha halys TaxID=286706 RepID=UPI0006D51187|nr:queuine tRNA-ribosyltransferase accessory subunit 2 isoform X2 [Halyomorpha halys]
MKFSVIGVLSNGARQGKLTNISRLPGVVLETPMLLFYTKGGSIPHITREVLDLLTKEQLGIQITLPSTIQCFEGAKAFGKGIAEFVGLKEMLTYCSVQDSARNTPEGYNSKEQISVWSNTGRVSVNADKYMDVIETFQPDFYQALSNGDTNSNSSKKKTQKVMDSSDKLLEKCLERHQSSSALKSVAVFGNIEGGYDIDLRKLSAQVIANKPVDGFIINGLHNNGPEVEKLDLKKVVPILKAVLKHLPKEKPRIIHGCWRPESILEMIDLGIDIFDSSLAYVVTERKSALIFQYFEIPVEECRTESFDECSAIEINLEDKSYKEDFRPILEDCTCLSCRKHSRSYIHHLIMNKELLASTLLMLYIRVILKSRKMKKLFQNYFTQEC